MLVSYHWFCLAFFILHTVSSYTTNERQAVESINTNQRKRTRMRTDDEGADDSNAADDDTVRKLCKRWVGSGIRVRIRQCKRYFIGLFINVRICLLLKSQPPGHIRMKYQLDSEHFIMCVFVMRVSGNKVISNSRVERRYQKIEFLHSCSNRSSFGRIRIVHSS